MLGWAYRAIERWARGNSKRLNKLADRTPLWYVPRLSEAKLVWTLRHVYRNSPSQRERWEAAGVRRRDLNAAKVLSCIPFTTGEDLLERPEDFICVPRELLTHLIGSSGTKGRSKNVYLTLGEMERQARVAGTHYRRFPGGTRALVMYPLDRPTWAAAAVIRRGLEQAGMFSLTASTGRSTEDQLALIRCYDINVLITHPPAIHRLTLEAGIDLRTLGVRYIHLGAQTWSEEFRRMIESAWGAVAIDAWGLAEFAYGIASECLQQSGLHVSEMDFLVEVINPETGENLPDGEEGELVVTTLSRRGMPLVRYRTGDLATLLPRDERCACGLPLRKMSRIRARVDDALIFGGRNFFRDAFDSAFLSMPGVSDYQLVVEQDAFKAVLHLTVEALADEEGVAERLHEVLLGVGNIRWMVESQCNLAIGRVRVVSPGTLSKGRAKSVRIVDRRSECPTPRENSPPEGPPP